MSAKILDGKWVRDQILAELRPRIDKLKSAHRSPGLAVILVGNDPASEIYVRNKIKTCAEVGIYSEKVTPPDTISTEELLGIIEGLNQRNEIDGILVQAPLPKQVDKHRVLVSLSIEPLVRYTDLRKRSTAVPALVKRCASHDFLHRVPAEGTV